MTIRRRSFWMLLSFLWSFGIAVAQEAIENWPAPASWSPPARVISKGEVTPSEVEAVEAVPTPPLHFVGITPCRLVDTRGNGFTGAYGPPSLPQGAPRNFVLAGQCGISPTAQAVSLNITVTNTQGPGFILIYPQGGAQPNVSTLNYVGGQTVANAAVVPLGTGGGVTVIAGVSGADLIIDTNGDYVAGVVTTLNGLSGNVNLAGGSNVTITPSGQTLTVASSGGLPSGTANQTLRHDGSNWVANSALQNNGTDVTLAGALRFSPLPLITYGPNKFVHTDAEGGESSTFLGIAAGFNAATGNGNTGIGYVALYHASTGGDGNTAVGSAALVNNSSGDQNVGVGVHALNSNTLGGQNIGVGAYALSTSNGSGNVAIGANALSSVSTGSGNIAIGTDVGSGVSTGSNNLYIASASAGNESNQIRIGRNDVHTQGTVIASIYGFGSGSGIPVIVNSGGRLGTTTSSARFKEDVRNIDSESDGLMKLRPVAFRYKESHEPGRLPQYGLIAEEVAKVYPELVVNDDEGRPFAIRSQLLDPLLLNEVQKQHRTIDSQRAEINDLKARLAKLEARLEGRLEP